MTIFLVRHAKAGSRRRWSGDDELRPLSERGSRQARSIADLLGAEPIDRIVSSPYLRCVQTVDPLAARLRLTIEQSEVLAEGAGHEGVLALAVDPDNGHAVMCTHGDVLGDVLWHLEQAGVPLPDDGRLEKGGIWALDGDGLGFTKTRYLPPP